MILPFDYEIRKPDNTVEERIYKEMNGIFNRAIEGLQRLLDNREFTSVKRGFDVLEQYQNRATSIDSYFDNIIYDETASGLFLHDLFNHYDNYMRLFYGDNWVTDKDVSIRNSRTLADSMRLYFADKNIVIKSVTKWCYEKQNGHRYFLGLRFKNEIDIIKQADTDDSIDASGASIYEEPPGSINFIDDDKINF